MSRALINSKFPLTSSSSSTHFDCNSQMIWPFSLEGWSFLTLVVSLPVNCVWNWNTVCSFSSISSSSSFMYLCAFDKFYLLSWMCYWYLFICSSRAISCGDFSSLDSFAGLVCREWSRTFGIDDTIFKLSLGWFNAVSNYFIWAWRWLMSPFLSAMNAFIFLYFSAWSYWILLKAFSSRFFSSSSIILV